MKNIQTLRLDNSLAVIFLNVTNVDKAILTHFMKVKAMNIFKTVKIKPFYDSIKFSFDTELKATTFESYTNWLINDFDLNSNKDVKV